MPDADRSKSVMATTSFGGRLMVPLDIGARGEDVAGLAVDLAMRWPAEIDLVSVVESEREQAIRLRYLSSLAEGLGAQIDHQAVIGRSIEDALVEMMTDDTSVIMHTAASVAPHQGHVGSLAESLVRVSSHPAILVGPRAVTTFDGVERIVVPVDGTEPSERALGPAAEMAALLGVPVWVVTVLTKRMQEEATALGVNPAAEANYVRHLASGLTGVDAEFEVLHRPTAAEAILDFAGRTGACVMSTHGRSGLARLTLGSVTAEVVRYATWPTVVVPPAPTI